MIPARRQIRMGYPKGGGLGVGDTFLFTPVCRQADVTWQMPLDSYCATDLASILQSVARIEYIQTPINETESLTEYDIRYGRFERVSATNAAQGYLRRYGLDPSDCIPAARPPVHEIEWAHSWLEQYRRPVVFTPVPGRFTTTDPTMVIRWVPPEHWSTTLFHLSKEHDILYFTSRDNHVAEFPYVHTLLGFSLAKIAAIQYVTKRHIGTENGLLHMGVAMGCTCWVALPGIDTSSITFLPYLYNSDLWGSKPNRVFYAHLTAPNQYIVNIVFP